MQINVLSSTRDQVGEDAGRLESCCREELASPPLGVGAGTHGSIQPDSCHITASELCGNFKKLQEDVGFLSTVSQFEDFQSITSELC